MVKYLRLSFDIYRSRPKKKNSTAQKSFTAYSSSWTSKKSLDPSPKNEQV